MAKVNVRLREFFAVSAFVQVSVESVLIEGQPVIVGNEGNLPGRLSKKTDATGKAPFDLLMGRYEVRAQGMNGAAPGLSYRVLIDVPDGSGEYEHTNLLVAGSGDPFSHVISASNNATALLFGLVRLGSSAGNGIPEMPGTLALLKAIPSARGAEAQLAFLLGGAAKGDGLGGVYFWDATGTDPNDDAAVVRPTDFGSAGVWRKLL